MLFSSRALARSFARDLAAASGGGYQLQNARTGEVLARALEGAFSRRSRNRGLLGRTTFEAGAGLVIAPCSAVHTWGMPFAIDVVFVSRAGVVRKIVTRVPPWRFAWSLGSFAVVELPAGVIEGTTRVGDTLVIHHDRATYTVSPQKT